MSLRFKVVIPARHASTRLPGKPLIDIGGKPMIAHVCERAQEAGADEIIVATDDERILQTVLDFGIKAVMTHPDHQSGTERIAEVARQCGWSGNEVIVNLQGDEPLIPPAIIREVAEGKYVFDHNVFTHRELELWIEDRIEGTRRSYSEPGTPFHPLSDREMEVLACVVRGMSNKEIASLLGISHQTVKNHVTAILRKFGVEDRTQAVVYALKRGWVTLKDADIHPQE